MRQHFLLASCQIVACRQVKVFVSNWPILPTQIVTCYYKAMIDTDNLAVNIEGRKMDAMQSIYLYIIYNSISGLD